MSAFLVRCQHEAACLCVRCADLLAFLASHTGHGHTPWG